MSINKVIIAGNLTRDGELKQTQAGMNILNFCVAVNDYKVDSTTGERNDYANFFDCTMFGERAAKLAPYLRLGSKVAVEGRLHYNVWLTKEGDKRSRITITAQDVELMSKDTGKLSTGGTQSNAPAQTPYGVAPQTQSPTPSRATYENQANVQDNNNQQQQQTQINYEGYDYPQQHYSKEIPF